ncbi:MAG: aminotransferase class III-fold pyridoxal phosphate-dependent enzyme [Flavobacteriales bacterium]|nr:aminotransferase class III-fold pyridoxal phosphate-dependent enzyme [Flavobacteriales bacterium]
MGEESKKIYNRAIQVLTGGVSRNTIFRDPHPFYVSTANGSYIKDVDGCKRLDFANNMASLIHGHSHPKIVEAVSKQLQKGSAFTMGSEIEVNYAELLNNRTKGFERIRFMNSGTEAVMTMIKAARVYTGKHKIAKAEGAYHGTYDYAEISQTATPSNWGSIENPNPVPVVEGTPEGVLNDMVIFPYNDIERTLNLLNKNADDIAIVLIDLVPHRVGLIPASKEYVEALYKWTRKNNAVLAFDEVVTYRINYSGAQESYNVEPDLTALGKIIGGGFPIGALAGKSEIMQVLDPRETFLRHPHSGTFSANPISITAGYTAMKMFDEQGVRDLNNLTKIAIKQVEEAIKLAGISACVTGAGSMFRVHFNKIAPTTYREAYQGKEIKLIINELLDFLFLEENIIMINTCACMFATTITQQNVDRLSEALLNGFKIIKPKLEQLKQ